MTKRRKPLPGASLRLELNITQFIGLQMALTCAQVGTLHKMLLQWTLGEDVPPCRDRSVQDLYERREEYARIRGSFGRRSLPLSKRRFVYERDNGVCQYCGETVAWGDYHCDHRVSVKRGGSDDISNLATACRPCNLAKGARPAPELVA